MPQLWKSSIPCQSPVNKKVTKLINRMKWLHVRWNHNFHDTSRLQSPELHNALFTLFLSHVSVKFYHQSCVSLYISIYLFQTKSGQSLYPIPDYAALKDNFNMTFNCCSLFNVYFYEWLNSSESCWMSLWSISWVNLTAFLHVQGPALLHIHNHISSAAVIFIVLNKCYY